MNTAHVRAEPAISTRNGMTVDLVDFSIASNPVEILEKSPEQSTHLGAY
jgi:hypothetical protein